MVERPRSLPRVKCRYKLRLYVAGMKRTSTEAIERVRELCEEHLRGEYELEVVDIYQLPALAKRGEAITAVAIILLGMYMGYAYFAAVYYASNSGRRSLNIGVNECLVGMGSFAPRHRNSKKVACGSCSRAKSFSALRAFM